jgi:penicillin-binding protein 2
VIATQDAHTRVEKPLAADPAVNLGYKPENVDLIRRAMVGVAQEGTSSRVFAGAGYVSGGKTGTAQAVSLGKNEKYSSIRMEERKRDHGLYIAFAPADDPKIALALIVENAGFGTTAAAPIARRAFDYWLLGQYPSEEDMLAVSQGRATAPIGKPRLAADVPLTPVVGVPNPAASAASAAASQAVGAASVARPSAPAASTAPAAVPAVASTSQLMRR